MTDVLLPDLWCSLLQKDPKRLQAIIDKSSSIVNRVFSQDSLFRGKSLLHLSCEQEVHECACLLLANGADVKIRNSDGQTPLMMCVLAGNIKLAQVLLLYKPTAVRCQDNEGNTALHYAVDMRNIAFVKLLLRYKCDVNISNHQGVTSLMALCMQEVQQGQGTIMFDLVQHGADVNTREHRTKYTALQHAALKRNIRLLEMMLHSGADPNATDRQGRTALTAVMEARLRKFHLHPLIHDSDMAAIEILTSGGTRLNSTRCKLSNPLVMAIFLQVEPLVSFFLRRGANPNVKFTSGLTPLMAAVMKGDLGIVTCLLSRGCDMDTKAKVAGHADGRAQTLDPFEMAVERGLWEICHMFVAAGYNLSRLEYLRRKGNGSPTTTPVALRMNRKLLKKLRQLSSCPQPLFLITALRLRRCLKSGFDDKLERLGLPVCLQTQLASRCFLCRNI